jgi:hypothetical protein
MNMDSTGNSGEAIAPRAKQRRWVTLLLAVMIFAAGLVTGAGLTVLVVAKRVQYAIQHPETAPARISAVLQRRLGLDDAQKEQVESIVAKRQVELLAIRRDYQPRVTAELEQLRDEIGEVLTPSQRERWTELFDEYRNRWLPPAPQVVAPQSS